MTSRDFCYWLQGYFEVLHAGTYPPDVAAAMKGLTPDQADVIRRHLAMVFAHEIDPKAGGPAHQKTLSDIHNPFHLGTGSDIVTDPKNVIARC